MNKELDYYRKKYKNEYRKGTTHIRSGGKWYKKLGFREPRKGDYFWSGAIPKAYLAYNDMSIKYLCLELDDSK